MDWGQFFHDVLFDYTIRTVAAGSLLLGVVSGVLGVYALLRRQSLLGDTISHAALPGVVLAFLLTGSKAPMTLLIGAMLTGWLGTIWLMVIVKRTRIKQDSALALVLSVFFGVGMVLLSYTQRLPNAGQAGLNKFLFGQAATMLESDVLTIAVLGATAILITLLLWKEFKLVSFDPDYAAGQGFPVGFLEILLTTLLVVAIVIGLQAVGVVLMSAMVVAPGAAARQWTDRLGVMVVLSAMFGGLAGLSGVFVSGLRPGLSTGPAIVLVISAIAFLSILLAPNRGLIAGLIRRARSRRTARSEQVLQHLFELGIQHGDPYYPHASVALRLMNSQPEGVPGALRNLRQRGMVSEAGKGEWVLTPRGLQEVENHRQQEKSNEHLSN